MKFIIEDKMWFDLCKEIESAWIAKGISIPMHSYDWDEQKQVALDYLTDKIQKLAANAKLPPCVEENYLGEGPMCGSNYAYSAHYEKALYGVPVKEGQRTLADYLQLIARLDEDIAYDLACDIRTTGTIYEWTGSAGYSRTWILPDGSLFAVRNWFGQEFSADYYIYSGDLPDETRYLVNTPD